MWKTYAIALLAVVAAVAVPILLVPQTDRSLVEGIIADFSETFPATAPPGQGAPSPTYHDVNVYYDVYTTKPKSLDPATSGDSVSAGIQANVFEPLYTYHYLKRPLELIPLVADGLPEMSADGLVCDIHIKKGVKYHRNPCFGTAVGADGKPVRDDDVFGKNCQKEPLYKTRDLTADDFVLAFKRIADYYICTEISYSLIEDKIVGIKDYRARTQKYDRGDFTRYDRENIEGVTAPDPATLRIRLTSPFPQLAGVLATTGFAPIPHEVIDYYLAGEQDPGGAFSQERHKPLPPANRDPVIRDYRAMVGTGPYYLREFIDGGRMIFRRNPDFRPDYYPAQGEERTGPDGRTVKVDQQAGLLADAGKRLPFIDVICMDYVPEPDPMWMLFVTRQTDAAAIPANVFDMVVTPERQLASSWAAQGVQLLRYTGSSVWWMTFNMRDPVLGNSSFGKTLRQAISLGYDVQQEIDILHNGRGRRAVNILPSGFEGHDQAVSPYARYDREAALKKIAQAKALLPSLVGRAYLPDKGVQCDRVSGKYARPTAFGPGDSSLSRMPALTLSIGATNEQARRFAEFSKQQFADLGIELNVELQDWPTLLQKIRSGQCQIYASYWQARVPDPQDFLQLFYSPNIQRGANTSFYSNPQFDALYEQAASLSQIPASGERTDIYVKMLNMLNEDCPFMLLSEPESFLLLQPWVKNVKPHPIAMGLTKYRRIDAAARKQAGGRP